MHELTEKTLAAYIRVSSDKQDGTRQRENIQAWGDANSLVISHWFEDSDGKNPRDLAEKRIDFQRLLTKVATGDIDAVIVDSLDRFGVKDAYEFGHYIHELRNHGVELWSVTQGNLSAADSATILTSTIGAITSTTEQEEKAHRSLQGKMRSAKNGEYVGGYPQYGFDVVCFDASGKEKFRIVWVGHYRRIKLTPDGREEKFDGKHNSPRKDPTDSLRFRPSIRTERIEAAQRIFEWYVNESISPSQIATRLNQMGVDPVFGKAWNKQKIKQLLKHPIYIGFPTCNKRASGRHKEFVGGREQPVPRTNGRTKGGRTRDPQDWWQPEERAFDPIVPVELFNQVQTKMKESSEKHNNRNHRPPRTASFWLRGLLVCERCGEPMRAWNSPGYRSYFCGTYGTYGKVNPTGCRSNRVKADLLESIVEVYIEETGQKAEFLLAATSSTAMPTNRADWESAWNMTEDAWEQMQKFIAESLSDGPNQFDIFAGTVREDGTFVPSMPVIVTKEGDDISIDDEAFTIFDLFRFLHNGLRVKFQGKIADLERQFDDQIEQFKKLTNQRAIDRSNAEMDRLDSEIKQMQDCLEPLDQQVHHAERSLRELSKAAKQAESAMKRANHRRKAETARKIIDRIECSFELNDTKAANRPKSLLTSVAVYPVKGEPVCYPKGIWPERD